MKPCRFVLAAGAVVFLTVAWAGACQAQPAAQIQPPALQIPAPPLQAQPTAPQGFLNTRELLSAKGLEKLGLSKEQKADFDKINEEYLKKGKEFQEKFMDLLKNPDSAAIKGAFQAQQKLRPDYLAKVEKLLTDDQKKTFEELRRESPGIGIGPIGLPPPNLQPNFGPVAGAKFLPADVQKKLKLSDDQRKKVDELQKELEAKILDVLTPDQKKALEELKKQTPRFGVFPNQPGIEIPIRPDFLPPGGGNPELEAQLKLLQREVEDLRKEVKKIQK